MIKKAVNPIGTFALATALLMNNAASAQASKQGCDMRLDLSDKAEVPQWRTVLDGVMGGRSTGVHFAEDGHMTFKGRINTNGGGFSSLRRPMTPGEMAQAKHLRLRIRQDTRAYKTVSYTHLTLPTIYSV